MAVCYIDIVNESAKKEHVHPADLVSLWEELGGVAAQIGPYVSQMRDAVRTEDVKKFKAVFRDGFFKQNRKALLYLSYVGLIDVFYSDKGRVSEVLAAVSSHLRSNSFSGHFNFLLPESPIPQLVFSGSSLTNMFLFSRMKRVYGAPAAAILKYLLKTYAANVWYGITTSPMNVEAIRTPEEGVEQFKKAIERGINTMLFVASSVFKSLDTLTEQQLIQMFGVASAQVHVEKKKDIALRSIRHFMPFALSNIAYFSELIQKGGFYVEKRKTKHGEDDVVVTTKGVKDLEMQLRNHGKIIQSPISLGVIKWRSNIEFVGCPAAYSPFFLDLARSLCESHYTHKA